MSSTAAASVSRIPLLPSSPPSSVSSVSIIPTAAGTRTSRRRSRCPVCAAPIVPGASVVPVHGGGGKIDWAHAACVPDHVVRPPCRHWSRLGRCPLRDHGESCAFGHPPAARGVDVAGRKWGGRRRRVRNEHRHAALRAFLHRTYDLGGGGDVVLDVASGQAATLAWELANLSGVAAAVTVEPRRVDVGRCSARWRSGHYEPSRLGPTFARCNPAVEEGHSTTREDVVPAQLRCFLDAEKFGKMVDARTTEEETEAEAWFHDERQRARGFRWTTRGLRCSNHHGEEDSDDDRDETVTELDNSEITSATEARNILRRATLVVGMHPDQAAGEIAAFAHRQRIPWCVVPCCVYSDEFPKRRLKDGTRVTTHDHLVSWLCETYPNVKTGVLDGLGGKNVVVYTTS